MDTTKEYIKQCEKAFELQKPWEPEEGDFCFFRDKTFVVCLGDKWQEPQLRPFCDYGAPENFDFYEYNIKESIWLPRQDQLQDLLADKNAILDPSPFCTWMIVHGGPKKSYKF